MSPPLREATPDTVQPAQELVRRECTVRVQGLATEGLAAPELSGQLIRPLLSLAAAGAGTDERFWQAALAVQYAHEASLLHDDVIDEAARRRGSPTAAAARGVAAALVEGDHLLTTAYRLAARTDSLPFAELFARAVERTVAGERRQGALRGRRLSAGEYREIVAGKSGELMGAAFAAAPLLHGDAHWERFYEVGRNVGVFYQLVDDLLDYCPAADTGKGALQDFQRRIHTWPLAFVAELDWQLDARELVQVLATASAGPAPLSRAMESLRATAAVTIGEVRRLLPDDEIVTGLLAAWLERAERGVAATLAAAGPAPATPGHVSAPAPPLLPDDAELTRFFARNSRSFSLAARLFPARDRARVADVYAFCRVTDDIADGGDASLAERSARLAAWLAVCRRAYAGAPTGVPVLERVLQEAARAGVPFRYVEELVAGMRMDLESRRYQSLADLRVYTNRVASMVGLWLTRLWGVHDTRVLARAADLGHAMQLTNIVRDVGEDWRAGRLYLPADLLARYQVDAGTIDSIAAGQPVPARWRALTEELMAVADVYYERAFAGIPFLPRAVRPAVAAAALVYQGIHHEVRRNGYDNVNRRAKTSLARKLWLLARALGRLTMHQAPGAEPPVTAPTALRTTLAERRP